MNYSQPAKYNRFQNTMEGLNVKSEKTWCPCHPTLSYNPARYKACFRCYEVKYACCARREFQV